GETEIMCLASNKSQNNGRKIIRIIDQQSTKHLSDEGLPWSLSGLWFDSKQKYFAVGDGFYCSTSLDQTWQAYTISADYKTSIRGNSINDIFVSGIHMLLMHFNGVDWKTYFPEESGGFAKVDICNNFTVAVGTKNNKGLIVYGYRK
ncbi:MAG: glucosyl transferase, partial [Bacteroidetes bacterium]|nr:glucosyl transferase [Bacteroidota bacterium]